MITTKQIWFGILLVFLFTGGFILSNYLISFNKGDLENKVISDKINDIEKAIDPYQTKDRLHKLIVIRDFQNSAKNNEPTDSFKKEIFTEGNFSQGYLYIRASVNSHSLNDADIYAKIGGMVNKEYKEFGGHLITSKSLNTPKSDSETELLFNLSDVKYKESFKESDIEIVSGNWLKLLNESDSKFILGFSSTEEIGIIKELTIFYDCVEGSDCHITTGNKNTP